MNKIYLSVLLLLFVVPSFSQTNPTIQSLPVSINFGTVNFTPPYTGMVAWTGSGTRPYGNIPSAEASAPGADVAATALFNTAPTTSSGQYGHAVSGDARLTIATSSNTTTGTTQAALAINTTGQTNISVAYSLTLTVANARDVGIALQYRVGNTGNFTTITGSVATYNSTSTNGGDLDGPTDSDNFSFTLPAAAEGNPEVQLRWITSRGAQAGNNSAIGLDNISIVTATPLPPCSEPTAQPANLVLNATASTVTGSFDLIPAPTTVQNYLIVRSTASSLTQLPVDGVTYTAGQAINNGNGTAVGISADGTFTNSVSPGTQYYYFIFAMNDQSCSGAPNYNQITPLTGNITTPALAACVTPAAPTVLFLTPANTTIAGSFTGSGASKYLSIISTFSSLSNAPVNGTVYTSGQTLGNGTIISYGAASTFTATGLTVATQYYLYVYAANDACTGEPFYSVSSLNGTSTTTNNTQGIPPGYYNAAAGLSCQPLKTAVKNIITSGSQVLGYTPGLWNIYQYSDLHRNDANTATIVWDMYSDNPTGQEPYTYTYATNQCGSYSTEGNCYNREHSSPQSWFNQLNPMVSDAHHIFPTDGEVNNMRSNYPYGEVTNLASVPSAQNNPSLNGSKLGTGSASQNFGYTGTVFEPIDAYKGDFARAGLYMAVRYEDEIISQNWSANGNANQVFLSTTDEPDPVKRRLQIYDAYYLNTLIKWHNQDPVSQKEIDRNNAIYYTSVNTTSGGAPKAQSNRNPFVDHPEYVAAIFQCTGVIVPVTLIDFTAQKNKESILLKWIATHETSFREYEVQRSTDGTQFLKIGAVAGRNLSDYSFTDNELPTNSVVYYRLKMIDEDGKFKNSKIISVRLNNNFSNAIVYPNPAFGKLNIKLDQAISSSGSMNISDVAGRTVKQQAIAPGTLNIGLDVNNLTAGRYFIRIITGKEVINQSFVVIK